VVAVGVTMYSTDPVTVLLGFVRIWLIVEPDPGFAPVIAPVIAPTVQEKLLGVEAIRAKFGPVPLHMVVTFKVVTAGEGFTVTVMVKGVPAHEPVAEVGVTM